MNFKQNLTVIFWLSEIPPFCSQVGAALGIAT